MPESKPKQLPPYGIRIPVGLKARVQASADENSRSLHAEIIHTLEEKYPAPVDADIHEAYELFTASLRRLKDLIPEGTDEAEEVKEALLVFEFVYDRFQNDENEEVAQDAVKTMKFITGSIVAKFSKYLDDKG